MNDLEYHMCDRNESWDEYDARGIYLCRVCPKCRKAKLGKYRFEVLHNSTYEADEPIEADDW